MDKIQKPVQVDQNPSQPPTTPEPKATRGRRPPRGNVDWQRLDQKLKSLINRILNKLSRNEPINNTEQLLLLNYNKLRESTSKPAGGPRAVAELTDIELEQALGKKIKD